MTKVWRSVLLIGVGLLAGDVWTAEQDPADLLAETILRKIDTVLAPVRERASGLRPAAPDKALVRTEVWREWRMDESGALCQVCVTGEIWTAAIQQALETRGCVRLPERGMPYYIDAPILLSSGQLFRADPQAEIRLKPNSNTCMIRNRNVVGMREGGVIPPVPYDTGIVVEGGIWTTLRIGRKESNGNNRGHPSRTDRAFESGHGVVLMNHADGLILWNLTIRQSQVHGLQLSNVRHFHVEGIRFEEHGRDGVHVHGASEYGVIRDVRGATYDDFIALNAWDWRNTTPAYGPIRHVLVEEVGGSAEDPLRRAGSAAIRLLPGTRTWADGSKTACPIEFCVLRRLTAIQTFKVYDQPNLELGRDRDFSDPIGTVRDLFVRSLNCPAPCSIEIAAHVSNFSVEDVTFRFPPAEGYRLIRVGPKSGTYKPRSTDPSTWVELFSPDKDITVRALSLRRVRVETAGKCAEIEDPERRFVVFEDQRPNPDYPKTTPKGGRGRVIRLP